ncbi:MAG: hypothetical protein RR929_01905 [Erysipelotrichaceae bacterium]
MIKDINEYLNTFILDQQLESIREFFGTNIIKCDESLYNIYINYQVLHKQEFYDYFEDYKTYFIQDLGIYDCINRYKQFMANYEYRDTATRKSRYAVQLTVLYPKDIVLQKKQGKFIRNFITNVLGKDIKLPFVVENVKRRNGWYAIVTIIERAVDQQTQYKTYRKTIAIDTRTGKFASKDCSEEYKKIIKRKGEVVRDKNGDPIPNDIMFSNSLRIFRYSASSNGKDMFIEFMRELKNKFTVALFAILTKKSEIKGVYIHKRQNKKEYHNVIRRRIAMINYAKDVITSTSNLMLMKEDRNNTILVNPREEREDVIIRTKKYKLILMVFEKYKARFKKEEYHDAEGNCRPIKSYKQRVDILEANIRDLILMFINEMKTIEE